MRIDIDSLVDKIQTKLSEPGTSYMEKLAYGNCLSLITEECLRENRNHYLQTAPILENKNETK